MNTFKSLAILIVVALAASSLIMLGFVSGQSTPIPSVPEFKVQLTDRSYDVPTSYSTDTYTGKTITHGGYRVESKTIDVIVKNQPFNAYNDDTVNATKLFYQVRVKGHFGDDWKYYSGNSGGEASSAEYTTLSFQISSMATGNYRTIYAPADSQIDFQVQAMIGYYYNEWVSMGLEDHPLAGGLYPKFHGQTSDWSNTQTLDMDGGSVSASASPMPTQTSEPTQTPPTPIMASPSTAITESPTAMPLQPNIQSDVLSGLGLWQVAVVVLFGVVVVLAAALLYKRRKPA